MQVLCRESGPLRLELIPKLGGCISRLTWNGTEILRSLPDRPNAAVNEGGCFALVPYSNRIGQAKFHFAGHDHVLMRNFGNHPHCIHGNGWQRPWQVVGAQNDRSVMLSLHHDAQASSAEHWPWPYRATQQFTLQDDLLQITLTFQNLAEHAAPAGLGFHPYFPRAAQSEILFEAGGVVLNGHDALPTGLAPVPAQWDYSNWRKPESATIDNCFTNWSGCATVRWPEAQLMVKLRSHDAPHAILFIPPSDRDFVAIEPVTHINNAINNNGFGDPTLSMNILPAGAQMRITMQLEISRYA